MRTATSTATSTTDSLRIGLIAPPWVAVPPPVYGGTEMVIDDLARGLTAAGHRVTLFTTGDSTCPVERRWLVPRAVGTTGALLDELGHVQAAYAELADCDIIHDHTLLGPVWSITEGVATPVVTTAHGPFVPTLTRLYESVADRVAVVAISWQQASTAPTVPIARVIHHGIDVDRVPVGRGAGDRRGDYVLFLGRMHPDKGVHRAINAARAAGLRIVIAAKMWEPAERQYFATQVEPLLGDDAEFIGEVGGTAKQQLLGGAMALVNPIRWPEPFGLAMVEALAAGTPVVTFAEGAAPEIVDDGRTGYLCADVDDMAARLRTIDRIERAACRAAAEERFSVGRMVSEHVELYRELLAARSGPGADDADPREASARGQIRRRGRGRELTTANGTAASLAPVPGPRGMRRGVPPPSPSPMASPNQVGSPNHLAPGRTA